MSCSIVMTMEWSIVMPSVMEHCDEKGFEQCDEKAMEPSDDLCHGAL